MEIKFIEIRDIATLIPVMVLKGSPERLTPKEQALWAAGGWGIDEGYYCIPIGIPELTQYDPFKYNDRTFKEAFYFIRQNWDQLETGQVVDVRHILGETDMPCESHFNG